LIGNWSYETDWGLFQPYADVLINMGTYPGSWARGISWPAWEYLKGYPCKPPVIILYIYQVGFVHLKN
jgi:hypothetical protein